jgi:hypothetical protein
MDEAEQQAKRQRLRELQAIPDRQRTDEQWDELNDLEIMFAAGNREGAPMPRGNNPGGGQPRPGGGPQNQNRNQGRKFHHRPPKRGGGGGGGGGPPNR